MNLIDQVKERLSIFINLYDVIRIVEPINKKCIIVMENNVQELGGECYSFWKKNNFCENCISMRAYINNDTFIKIEYDKDKIFLVTATPIDIDGIVYIVEILKDITQNGTLLHKLTENSNSTEELISSINEKAVKDELTGLYNRRYINERLPIDINYYGVSKLPLSIIMVDIDFFKKVNDKYGHVIGDKLLIDFSNLILSFIKDSTNWVGRYGGEEFIIVLNNVDLKNAYSVAEKIRKQLENTTFKYDEININITASFGIYSITDSTIKLPELLSKVDKSLYEAKLGGRNKTIINKENINDSRTINNNDVSINLARLNEQIGELREILNEVCCTLDVDETYPDILSVSQCLDELIVEYMKEINKLK